VYGGSEDEWVTFGSGRMIMGSDPQLPMTGGSLVSGGHALTGDEIPDPGTAAPVLAGNSYTAFIQPFNVNGTGDPHTHILPRNPYIQTFMWTKILYYDSIIYSAAGDAMGTFAEVLGSLYPVGAQIYRTSAISAHPSDATKVQPFPTEAPLQQWQLVDNGSNPVPLEYLTQLGETTSYCGRATLTPATATHHLTSSFGTITGTEITDFTPVVGTTKILYKINLQMRHQNHNVLFNLRVQVKEGTGGTWTTIDKTSLSYYDQSSYANERVKISTIVNLGDTTTDLSEGRVSTVRPSLNFRVIGRNYSTSYKASFHESHYDFNSDGSHLATSQFVPPTVDIVSIGPETQALMYQRTA
jgi:hypothetical protein